MRNSGARRQEALLPICRLCSLRVLRTAQAGELLLCLLARAQAAEPNKQVGSDCLTAWLSFCLAVCLAALPTGDGINFVVGITLKAI